MAKLQLTALLWLSLASAVYADATSELALKMGGADLVAAFVSNCAQNSGRIDKIEAAAKAFGYLPLESEAAQALGPQAKNADFSGWLVTDGIGAPYALGVSRGKAYGQEYEVCSISNPYIASVDVTSALQKTLRLGAPGSDDYQAGQRYRTWDVQEIADGAQLIMMDADELAGGGVTLSIATPTSRSR